MSDLQVRLEACVWCGQRFLCVPVEADVPICLRCDKIAELMFLGRDVRVEAD